MKLVVKLGLVEWELGGVVDPRAHSVTLPMLRSFSKLWENLRPRILMQQRLQTTSVPALAVDWTVTSPHGLCIT